MYSGIEVFGESVLWTSRTFLKFESKVGSYFQVERNDKNSSRNLVKSLFLLIVGYVSATDFAVLERQRAIEAQAMFMKQRFWNQRQNAIKIAKEFQASSSGMASSETATKLLAAMNRSMASVISGSTNPGTTDTKDDKEEKLESLDPRHQMKILCFAVGAVLSFQDYTKVLHRYLIIYKLNLYFDQFTKKLIQVSNVYRNGFLAKKSLHHRCCEFD